MRRSPGERRSNPGLPFSPRGEAKCVRGLSGRGARRLARAGVLAKSPPSPLGLRNTAFPVHWLSDISSGANQAPSHGFHESRDTKHESRPFIACSGRRVVRNAGWRASPQKCAIFRCAIDRSKPKQGSPARRRFLVEQLQARPMGFSRDTRHETRITAFFRITAFPVARLVPVGTEALQSCFFRSGMLGVRTGCRKSAGSTCPQRGARWDGGKSRTLATRPLRFSTNQDLTGFPVHGPSHISPVERTPEPRPTMVFTNHETRDHETRLFSDTSFVTGASLVLKPFSLFFPPRPA